MKTKLNRSLEKENSRPHFLKGKNDAGFFSAQAKLEVGEPGDKFEAEADLTAEKFLQNSRPQNEEMFSGQKKGSNSVAAVQEKPLAESVAPLVQKQVEEEEEELMPKSDIKVETPGLEVERQIQNEKGRGNLLESGVRSEMEQGFGADFSEVKIHTGDSAVQLNSKLNSRAFTTGNNIFFNQGQFQPKTQNGKRLLAHELTHTIQQGGSLPGNSIQKDVIENYTPADNNSQYSNTNSCDEAETKEKESFINHGIYGPVTISAGYGGFDAVYYTEAENLNIEVRGKTNFIDGLSMSNTNEITSNDRYLNDLAGVVNFIDDKNLKSEVVNAYTWTEDEKKTASENFKKRLEESVGIWGAGAKYTFVVDKPCWEDVKAKVEFNIDVEEIGNADFNNPGSGTRDHIQVKLVKNPDFEVINDLETKILEAAEAAAEKKQVSIDDNPEYTTTANVSFDNKVTLTNFDLNDTPNDNFSIGRSNLRRRVFFDNNKWKLTREHKRILDGVIEDFKSGDNIRENNKITLMGYASKPGTAEYNLMIADKRLDEVYNYLKTKGLTNIDERKEQVNYGDTRAEMYGDEFEESFRRVEIVIGSGELQNTVAHELGHVFQLDDEYVTPEGEKGSGRPLGKVIDHNSMAEDIGVGTVLGNRWTNWLPGWTKALIRNTTGEGVRAEDSDNIMSMGNVVRKQHYGPFGKALNKLTGKMWKIIDE